MYDAGSKTTKGVPAEPQELEEHIRQRAYELYEARGREQGHELEDWLRAEEEVRRSPRRRAVA